MPKFAEFLQKTQFKSKPAESNLDYLAAAEALHPFLERHKLEDANGVRWRDSVPVPGFKFEGEDLSLYTGSAGIAYFYLELYRATKKAEYETLALKAAHYLAKNWETQIATAANFLGPESATSIFLGITSIGQVLAQFHKHYQDAEFLDALRAIAEKTIGLARKEGDTIFWSEDESVLMGGGATLFLYRASQILHDERILEFANKAADGILARSIRDERGGLAWTSYAHPGQTRVPNFECGTAGIGLVLANAFEVSGREKYLDAAKEAAKHVKALAVKVGEGFLIPYHDNKDEAVIFYASTCHGPAGTSRLFYKLYELTKDESYLGDVKSLCKGLIALGAPETQSPGYWNTLGICCGTAGILQFFLNLSLITGCQNARAKASSAGNILLGTAEAQTAGRAWPFAFERIHPENITTSITYGTGSAGIGIALIQLYLFLEGKYDWDRFFEDPYPAKG